MVRKQTIESKTADTILQRVQTIKLGGKEYIVAPPTLGTLILVSEAVGDLPAIELNSEDIVTSALRDARYFRGLARVAAILILGSKRMEVEEEYTDKKLWGIISHKRMRKVDMCERITEELMHNVELAELNAGIASILAGMQTEHFFALASFLTNINLTKATREEATTPKTKATAYGQ